MQKYLFQNYDIMYDIENLWYHICYHIEQGSRCVWYAHNACVLLLLLPLPLQTLVRVIWLLPCIEYGNLWSSWEWWLLCSLFSLFVQLRVLYLLHLKSVLVRAHHCTYQVHASTWHYMLFETYSCNLKHKKYILYSKSPLASNWHNDSNNISLDQSPPIGPSMETTKTIPDAHVQQAS